MSNQVNRVAVACDACHVLRANLLKPDLCELSKCRDEPQVVLIWRPSSRKDRLFDWTM
jgi:hypothetical protein